MQHKHPHGDVTPGAHREGNPRLVSCQVLTRLSIISVPRHVAYGSCVCVCVFLVSLYLTQLFGECRGPPRVRNDVRAPGHREADICCGIPEFRLRSVFGTQLSGIRLILPLRFVSLSPFLLTLTPPPPPPEPQP